MTSVWASSVRGVANIEGRRIGGLRVDDDEAILQRIPDRQLLDCPQHLALAVDDDHRRRIGFFQMREDQRLQQLGLAVSGAAINCPVFLFEGRQGERYRGRKKFDEISSCEVGVHKLILSSPEFQRTAGGVFVLSDLRTARGKQVFCFYLTIVDRLYQLRNIFSRVIRERVEREDETLRFCIGKSSARQVFDEDSADPFQGAEKDFVRAVGVEVW